ncbi:MAG: type IV pilus assembly protein PilM [Actinomycetota bacterium]|nr:type IV pilus assembly protein PilM [Actinomycetota bacterium]
MAQVVGLDIGTSAVRAAELDLASNPPVLTTYGQVGLPPGAIVDGEIQDVSAVSDAITRLWRNGGFRETSVVVGLAGLRAITREMDLPYVPDDEVDQVVRFQAEEVIPFPADRTVFSTQVLADYNGPDGTAMRRVLVAAAHRDLVDGVVTAIESAGLQVAGVDLVSSALVRAITTGRQGPQGYAPQPAYAEALAGQPGGVQSGFGQPGGALGPLAPDQPEAIVSVGAGLTVVVVHQAGRPQFVRTVGTAGNAASAAISAALDLPVADAEGLKRRLGEPTPQVQAAEKAVQPVLSELVGEIRNSVQFFASLPGRAAIARILVTGGGAQLRGFLDQLQAETRLPVLPISPLSLVDTSGLALSPDQVALIDPVLATPIGLALPEAIPGAKKFNLVPAEVVERAEQRRLQRYAITGGIAALVLILAFSGWRFWQVHQANSRITSLTSSVATLKAQVVQYDPVVRATDAVRTSTTQVQQVAAHAVDWPAVLGAIGPLTPSGLSITTFDGTTTGPGAAASGSTASSTASPAEIGQITATCSGTGTGFVLASQWIDGVGSSKLFDTPLVPSVTVSGGQVSFTSTVGITPAASLAHNPNY